MAKFPVMLPIAWLAATSLVYAQPISACMGDVPMPPFAFVTSDGRPTGFAIDLLKRLLENSPYQVASISVLPVSRCQAMVLEKQIDLGINVPTQQGGGKTFRLSKPYYKLRSVVLYNSQQHPGGLPLKQLVDLQNLRVCGLQGVRLDSYGLLPGQVDSGAKSYTALLRKLLVKRCDVVIEKREVLGGLYLVAPDAKQILESSALSFAPLPGDTEVSLHFGTANSAAQSDPLLGHINSGIANMIRRNELPQLMQPYMP